MYNEPRSEYPRPNFVRNNWQNLNGEWEFYIDYGASGIDRKVYLNDKFDGMITVPFCPESILSGVHNTDFMPSVWYAKNIKIDKARLFGRAILHFGACDYLTTVYINGKIAGKHIGGYTSFEFDITEYLTEGSNRIVVNAYDNMRANMQSVGKQSREYYSHLCDYTRTTGIWQTVWLEFVPAIYLKKVKVTATDLSGTVMIEPTLSAYAKNAILKTKVSYNGIAVCENVFELGGVTSVCAFNVKEPKLWAVGEPNLYDIEYELVIDETVDRVKGYFGIRRIDIDGYKVLINGKSVFQRLILDQGFYPDGIYTAPNDEALRRDIDLSMQLGFNGARLHQKVFEERYLYHADKAGYLVWGEFADWGIDISKPEALHEMLPQWLEAVARDYNHPCIICWCPHNETWDFNNSRQLDTNISVVYEATKAVDNTRPVIDTSGNFHTQNTDIFDVHDYDQNGEELYKRMRAHDKGEYNVTFPDRQSYDGKIPYMISECGGIRWSKKVEDASSWGYGDAPKSVEEFIERFNGIVSAIMSSENTFGFCYTQLTDVEQEENGLYYYDRTPKFTREQYDRIKAVNEKKAEIEK